MYAYVDQYIVRPGDTLYNIANTFELLTYKQILHVNPQILNPYLIYPGQVINIPKIIPMYTYIVQPGDNLSTIIHNYNMELMEYYGIQITLNEVLAYNPGILNPNQIFADMIIYLPEIL